MSYHKNQAMCKLNHCLSTAIQCIVIVINDVMSKSYEQRLITKGYIRYFAKKTLHYIREHSRMVHEASSTAHDTSRIAHECIKQKRKYVRKRCFELNKHFAK